jgi:hypothetical protein
MNHHWVVAEPESEYTPSQLTQALLPPLPADQSIALDELSGSVDCIGASPNLLGNIGCTEFHNRQCALKT